MRCLNVRRQEGTWQRSSYSSLSKDCDHIDHLSPCVEERSSYPGWRRETSPCSDCNGSRPRIDPRRSSARSSHRTVRDPGAIGTTSGRGPIAWRRHLGSQRSKIGHFELQFAGRPMYRRKRGCSWNGDSTSRGLGPSGDKKAGGPTWRLDSPTSQLAFTSCAERGAARRASADPSVGTLRRACQRKRRRR